MHFIVYFAGAAATTSGAGGGSGGSISLSCGSVFAGVGRIAAVGGNAIGGGAGGGSGGRVALSYDVLTFQGEVIAMGGFGADNSITTAYVAPSSYGASSSASGR